MLLWMKSNMSVFSNWFILTLLCRAVRVFLMSAFFSRHLSACVGCARSPA